MNGTHFTRCEGVGKGEQSLKRGSYALSGILLVELVLRRKQWGLDDWDALYKVWPPWGCGVGM